MADVSVIQYFRQKSGRPAGWFPGEELRRGNIVYYRAVFHEDNPVGHFSGEPHLMRDDHHGHAVFGQSGHDIQDFTDHFGVESGRSEEHTSELQSLMRITYAVF